MKVPRGRGKGHTSASMVDDGSALREQPVVWRIALSQDIHTLWDCCSICCAQLAPSWTHFVRHTVTDWPQTQLFKDCKHTICNQGKTQGHIAACLAASI